MLVEHEPLCSESSLPLRTAKSLHSVVFVIALGRKGRNLQAMAVYIIAKL